VLIRRLGYSLERDALGRGAHKENKHEAGRTKIATGERVQRGAFYEEVIAEKKSIARYRICKFS